MSPTDSRQGAMLDANCPRCGAGFECGANAGRCDCFGIRLTDVVAPAERLRRLNRV